ncbi:zinc-binding dehydrogenase [Histidinibacterium aquaticum]|uniref:Alcohol dehydrogenase catalytic domain-containing protein n=1 Tax=Histidinibacterium aquaticum TaxID=2613962 RepID=A0A5J5GPW5_9RHOB|nr:alcohol dehydrogenase catalytic domain-containing protein [Histidinibacterium aquaticum]KAA9009793.1 alcohol dehydrogenase catalytic domain-containing protein [Histidinibacterium aquaticum]
MRAAVLRDYRAPLALEDRPEPDCPEDGVVLRVIACGVCRSDWHAWAGEHPRVKPGAVGGHEYCGEVVAAGPRSDWAVGDVLVAPFLLSCGACPACRAGEEHTCPDMLYPGLGTDGAFAEYVAVPRDHNLQRLPEGMDPVLAAGLGCRVMTAWHGLTDRAALQPGEWLAVHGTGGVGLAGVLLGRAMGARVVAVDLVQEKLDHALAHGAEAAVLASEPGAAERIREITGGGAHVSLEAVGIEPTLNGSIACLRPLGRHVQCGMPIGHTARMEIDLNGVFMKNLAVYGSKGMPAHRYPQLFSLIESGAVDLTPMIGRQIALSEVSAELAAMEGPTAPGVAVVTDFRH